jgi:hypothetical protein
VAGQPARPHIPLAGEPYVLTLPGGATEEGELDENGRLFLEKLQVPNELKHQPCALVFPRIDAPDWDDVPIVEGAPTADEEPIRDAWLVIELLDEDGVFVSESHYWVSLVETLQYDTIYHEHLRYYSLTSLKHLLEMHGLEVFHARRIPTHGGSIRVYSEEGHGTTFKVYLPYAAAGSPPAGDGGNATPVRGRGRILVVDDETMVRDVAVEMLQHTEPDSRRSRAERHALACDELEQADRIEIAFGQHELCADHYRRVRQAPGVDVEHGDDRQDHVALTNADEVSDHPRQPLKNNGTMGVEHSFRHARGPGRVAHGGGIALVDVLVYEAFRIRACDQGLEIDGPIRPVFSTGCPERGSRAGAPAAHHHDAIDGDARLALRKYGKQAMVHEDEPILGVVDDVGQLVGMQARIQGVQHCTNRGNRKIRFEMLMVIPRERGYPVAADDAKLFQTSRQPLGAVDHVRVTVTMHGFVGLTTDDLGGPVKDIGPPENGGNRQLTIHHETAHGSLFTGGSKNQDPADDRAEALFNRRGGAGL